MTAAILDWPQVKFGVIFIYTNMLIFTFNTSSITTVNLSLLIGLDIFKIVSEATVQISLKLGANVCCMVLDELCQNNGKECLHRGSPISDD